MNRIQYRNNNAVPLTPNLEEYKQKNKSKSRRKNPAIQPTNPPTPKVGKSNHLQHEPFLKNQMEKSNSHANYHLERNVAWNDLGNFHSAAIYPEKKTNSCLENINVNANKYCAKGTFTNLDQNDYQRPIIEYEKRNELQNFKVKVAQLEQKLRSAEEELKRNGENRDCKFHEDKAYIKDTFSQLRCLLDEKQRELLNNLNHSLNASNRAMKSNLLLIEEIKKSLQRYSFDIDKNYEDIISDLSFDQFQEIMRQYNAKVSYYSDHADRLSFGDTTNAYIPFKQIEKVISRASVQYIQPFDDQETMQNSRERDGDKNYLSTNKLQSDLRKAYKLKPDIKNYRENNEKLIFEKSHRRNVSKKENTNSQNQSRAVFY